MILHYYTPTVKSYCVGIHNGHGFGSLFAKLFSKVAVKTAAKTALKAAKVAGKKAIRVVAKKGAEVVKDVAKEGIKAATEIGTDYATHKINEIANKALNKDLPPEIVHSIQGLATKGVDVVGNKLKTTGVDKVHSFIDKGSSKIERFGYKVINKGAAKGNKLIDPRPEKRKKKTTSKGLKKRKINEELVTKRIDKS